MTEPLTPDLVTAAELMRAMGLTVADARMWAPALNAALQRWEIVTPLRITHFLAQVGHETLRLRYIKEVWGPTTAQRRYERDFNAPWPPESPRDRNWIAASLGNSEPGDGKQYRGRGLIQLTGRYNYDRCGKALGLDLIDRPALLEIPYHAAQSAGWYWATHKLNAAADRDDFAAVTRGINPGMAGIKSRMAYLETVRVALA